MENIDVIVAGAGIWGSTVARRLAEAGRKVLVLDKRNFVGGNVRCEIDPETGIEIHTYGSHIFHTHLPDVWQFVNRFTTFNGYQHKVLAKHQGRIYHLPLGLTLINKFFGVELNPAEVVSFLDGAGNRAALFDAFFRGYTSKQWGRAPEDIDPSIIKRVPVRANYDTNYFNDLNQGIPLAGYNALFKNLLEHPNIKVTCACRLCLTGKGEQTKLCVQGAQQDAINAFLAAGKIPVFYSGPIDELFGYEFGALPWRTLRFERETLDVADYQGTSVINYPDLEVPFTRIHEFKHYHPEGWGFTAPKTVIMREYSATWKMGDEPYYPIDNDESRALLARYQQAAESFNLSHATAQTPLLTIGGRLGGYKYYDMDKSIAAALALKF